MPDHRMRLPVATRLLPGLAAAIALALSASGCGASSATLDPVAQAAEATSHAGGAHMALSAQVSAPGLSAPLTLSGEGIFNYVTREGSMSLDLSGLPGAAAGSLPSGGARLNEIFKSSAVYVSSPIFAGKLPGGARWMKIDLGRVGQAAGLNLEQLAGGQSNPAQLLEYLKGSGGSVTTVGHELVRGVPTTHFSGTVDLGKVADAMPSTDRSQLRKALAKVIAATGLSSLPVDVWVDAHRLVRRIALVMSIHTGSQQAQLHITIDLFGFGATPSVSAPPAGEVYDATPTALGALRAGGG
jgi:hypothetical protein